jgi:hypothetical protein
LIDEIQLTQSKWVSVLESVLHRITWLLKLDPLSKQVSVTDSLVYGRAIINIEDQEVNWYLSKNLVKIYLFAIPKH